MTANVALSINNAARPTRRPTGKMKCHFVMCVTSDAFVICVTSNAGVLLIRGERDGMWKLVAAAMALVASSHFALGANSAPKKSGNASCVHLSNGKTMCLTCQDGPCDIKSGPGNPITIITEPAIARHTSANSPKPKVSASHPMNDETKR